MMAISVCLGVQSTLLSLTGSAVVGALFRSLYEFCENSKICPGPTVGDMGVKFVRSVSDLNIPKEKKFWGSPCKIWGN